MMQFKLYFTLKCVDACNMQHQAAFNIWIGKCPSGFHFNVSHYITIQHSCSRLDESKVSSYKNHLLEQEINSVKTKERIT